MEFVVKVLPDDGSYMVTCPELPEFLSAGDTAEEALQDASDALETTLMLYMDDRRQIPSPRKSRRGEITVRLSAQASAKALLHNAMLADGIRKAELARRLGGISGSQVERLLDLRHSTRLEALESAIEAVGRRLVVAVA